MPSSQVEQEVRQHLRYNVTVNMFDGAFFGFGFGFSSLTTFVPIFLSRMTSSAILFGLVPSIHNTGWLFPQLLTAGWVSRLRRYKPSVLLMTVNERLPFVGLAAVAWFLPGLGRQIGLVLTFLLLAWQGLGAGFTANPWTSFIAKIIPSEFRGTFFGSQAAASNFMMSVGAVLAGILLTRVSDRFNFSLIFLLTFGCMIVSWIFLSSSREPVDLEKEVPAKPAPFWKGTRTILRKDVNFRWFITARMLSQIAITGFAFYIIYCVKQFSMNDLTAGILTAASTISQIIANPLMGWAGDRWGHHTVLLLGAFAAVLSGLLAWYAPGLIWFYPAMVLAGLANVAVWTIGMAMTVEFGSEAERPVYIGLSNTLVAPFAILAPIFGGWLADAAGYRIMFLFAAAGGLITMAVLYLWVRDPRHVDKTPEPASF
ncbi:MAG: MFS transporter [Anaerolineales bacterium]|jgi:MFS family permease